MDLPNLVDKPLLQESLREALARRRARPENLWQAHLMVAGKLRAQAFAAFQDHAGFQAERRANSQKGRAKDRGPIRPLFHIRPSP